MYVHSKGYCVKPGKGKKNVTVGNRLRQKEMKAFQRKEKCNDSKYGKDLHYK